MEKEPVTPGRIFSDLLEDNEPQAMAWVKGGSGAPYLSGLVKFYEAPYGGVLIEAELFGLPNTGGAGSSELYDMNIDTDIRGNESIPPLLSSQGYAWISFYGKHLTIPDILGGTVAVSRRADNPAGQSSGKKEEPVGSGVIRLTGSKSGSERIRRGR